MASKMATKGDIAIRYNRIIGKHQRMKYSGRNWERLCEDITNGNNCNNVARGNGSIYCATHRNACEENGCLNKVYKDDKCKSHHSSGKCTFIENGVQCVNLQQSNKLCNSHNSKRTCEFLACTTNKRTGSKFCSAHGGSKKCTNCKVKPEQKDGLCKMCLNKDKRCIHPKCIRFKEKDRDQCSSHGYSKGYIQSRKNGKRYRFNGKTWSEMCEHKGCTNIMTKEHLCDTHNINSHCEFVYLNLKRCDNVQAIGNYCYQHKNGIQNDKKISIGEDMMTKILTKLNIEFTPQKFINHNGKKMYFDFWFKIHGKQCVIEVDGDQHFNSVDIWGGDPGFEKRQTDDIFRNDYCMELNINLLRIYARQLIHMEECVNEFINLLKLKESPIFMITHEIYNKLKLEKYNCTLINVMTNHEDVFVKKLSLKYPKYTLSSNYVNMVTKTTFTCEDHGEFSRLPNSLLYKDNICGKCRNPKTTLEEMVARAVELFGDRFDYSKFIYKTTTYPSVIQCIEHNIEFNQSFHNHFNHDGCHECILQKTRDDTKVNDNLGTLYPQFIPQWSDKNDLTIYEITSHSNIKRWWKCLNNHDDYQTSPNNRVRGTNCKGCSRSGKGANMIDKCDWIDNEWDFNANAKPPSNYKAGSKYNAHWICPKCQTKYQKIICNRCTKKSYRNDCPNKCD